MVNKANQEYWSQVSTSVNPYIAKKSDIIRIWIEKHLPSVENKTCIEIGCYPGRYLAVFGELGYELYGIDLAEKIKILPESLSANGYKVGKFWQEDFINFDPSQQFDLVASFGFIEHFTDWERVLDKHIELVKTDGYLIMEAPNFIGSFQYWLHSNFDKKNFDHHHLPAMEVEKWGAVLKGNFFDIVYRDYFGGFHFWVEKEKRNIFQKAILKTLRKAGFQLNKLLPPQNKIYSPYGGIIAKKISK